MTSHNIFCQRSWREFPTPLSPLSRTPLPPLLIHLSEYPAVRVIFHPESPFISLWTYSFILPSFQPFSMCSNPLFVSLWVARSKQHIPHHHSPKSGSTPSGGNYVDYMIVEPPQSPLRMQTASMDPYSYHQVHIHTHTSLSSKNRCVSTTKPAPGINKTIIHPNPNSYITGISQSRFIYLFIILDLSIPKFAEYSVISFCFDDHILFYLSHSIPAFLESGL